MKQLLTILFVFLLGYVQTFAQITKDVESFKEKVLPKYNMYFSQAELTDNGHLNLTALDKYIGLSTDDKKTIMVNISKAWQDSLVLVNYGSKRELWGWSTVTANVQLLDDWDLSATHVLKMPVTKLTKTALHPWFFYVGGQLGGDNQGNTNFAFNTRLGFFLLANRWDFASTFSTGTTGSSNDASSTTGWVNFGLMSRVYFPIKNTSIRPNIGSSLQFGNDGTQASLSLGICWFVGFGSVDIAFNIGNEFTTMGGYTIMPKTKNNK
jgi:hypothetical protein